MNGSNKRDPLFDLRASLLTMLVDILRRVSDVTMGGGGATRQTRKDVFDYCAMVLGTDWAGER